MHAKSSSTHCPDLMSSSMVKLPVILVNLLPPGQHSCQDIQLRYRAPKSRTNIYTRLQFAKLRCFITKEKWTYKESLADCTLIVCLFVAVCIGRSIIEDGCCLSFEILLSQLSQSFAKFKSQSCKAQSLSVSINK